MVFNKLKDKRNSDKNLSISNGEYDRIKSEFLSNMSHELRTPIHAILNLARLCREDIDEANYKSALEQLNDITLSSERLLFLLNDLLDLSKLEAKKNKFIYEKSDIVYHLKHCVKELQSLSKSKEPQHRLRLN